MEKRYISFDIEASGRTPGINSMLSLGACLVDDILTGFYTEIKPISRIYNDKAMRIGSLWLHCLEEYSNDTTCNPHHVDFLPSRVLEILQEKWISPKQAMSDYADWIKTHTTWYKPVEVAAPIKFDSMWTTWYFENFYTPESNPFWYTWWEDMNSMYRGVTWNLNGSVKDLFLRDERWLPHNALEDAVQQAKEFQVVLKMVKNKCAWLLS